VRDKFISLDIAKKPISNPVPTLAALVAPKFPFPEGIRSGRYYARGGPTRLYLRNERVSHCVGTSLGGAPLYAVPLSSLKNPTDRDAFLEFANWHREQDDLLVMRLRPDRTVALFGSHTAALCDAVNRWKAGDSRKYKIVGNMVAPVCAKNVAELINLQLAGNFRRDPVPPSMPFGVSERKAPEMPLSRVARF
jgi:hypothetical protein